MNEFYAPSLDSINFNNDYELTNCQTSIKEECRENPSAETKFYYLKRLFDIFPMSANIFD